MSKYVIIGGSAGGIGAVEAIREVDPVGTLTVISEETVPQYSRPMISEYVSKEATDYTKPVFVKIAAVHNSAAIASGIVRAGADAVVLGTNIKDGSRHDAKFVGTGMHGGTMYIRGEVRHLGEEVEVTDLKEEDFKLLRSFVDEFCNYYGLDAEKILESKFNKLVPVSSRPYGNLYAY